MTIPWIILVNGPPRSGKDTFGSALVSGLPGGTLAKFAEPLKRATHALVREFTRQPTMSIAHDAFEACKDEARPEFCNVTPRQAYIAVSELLCKPLFGERFFGELAADLVADRSGPVVFTDSGFAIEAEPLIERFGSDAVRLFKIERDGCDFAGDSRGYLDLDVPTVIVKNEGGVEQLHEIAHECATGLVAGQI